MSETVVIAGAGQAGFQTAASLRQAGHARRIVLVGDERELPYQRPPLSKGYFKDGRPERLLFRNADFYAKNRIELRLGTRIETIDRPGRRLLLEGGAVEPYDHLVLALGARNRRPPVEGLDLAGVLELRSLADADAMRRRAAEASHVVIIGGGFIGLEAASVFRAAGFAVTVLEAGPRLMGRAVSEAVSDYFLAAHRAAGAVVRLSTFARRVLGETGSVAGVELSDGTILAADTVLLAAGVVPNSELAERAGLAVGNGILTDRLLSTSDPAISALGDCAAVPQGAEGPHLRLESVQAAVDQAKCLAERLAGRPAPYARVPWFWSDQGSHKLQIVGLATGAETVEVTGSPEEGRLVVTSRAGGRVVRVETVNAAAEHIAARRAMEAALAEPAVAL